MGDSLAAGDSSFSERSDERAREVQARWQAREDRGIPISGDLGQGMSPLLKKVSGEIETGELKGVQLYVSRGGRVQLNAALGWARAGVPLAPDTIAHWLCCTKPLVAILIAGLEQAGRLDVDAPVAQYWPEFGCNDKAHVTLRALLHHRSGIRGDPAEEYLFCSHARVAEAVASCEMDSAVAPGRSRYIHFSGWAALAEIVRRVSGQSAGERLQQEVFAPLGMQNSYLGIPASRFDESGASFSRIHIAARGSAAECSFLNWPEVIGYDWPGFAARGPAQELGRVYESLLGFGPSILARSTVERFTSPSLGRLYDENLQDDVDWALGFKTSAAFFGCRESVGRVFGHTGLGSSFCLAMPDWGLVAVWVSNVISPPPVHRARIRRLVPALLSCVGVESAAGR